MNMKYDWNNLTLGKFIELYQITQNETDEDTAIMKSAALLNGLSYDEIMDMPLDRTRKLLETVSFLYTEPKKGKPKKKYTFGDMKLIATLKPEKMTTAQYIDFQAICKMGNEMLAQFMSIFLIPEGHTYNDGYDNDEVVEAIRNYMTAEEALSLADFFVRKCTASMKRTLMYLESQIIAQRLMTRDKETKALLKTVEKRIQLLNSTLG